MNSPSVTIPGQLAMHPLDFFKADWQLLAQRSIYTEGVMVLHCIKPPDEFEQPPLTHHLLVFVLSQVPRQVTRIDGQEYDGAYPPSSFLLQPQDALAAYAWESIDEDITILLTPEFLQRIAAQTECLNPDQLELRPVLIGQDPQIEQLALAFYHEMQTEGLGGQLYAESLANCLAIHLLRHYCTRSAKLSTPQGGLSKTRLSRALEVIHASLEQSLRLETVAAELGLNVHYFSRLFRQSMGVPPYQYVLQQRIEKAKRLLKDPDLSIAEIAMDCGFANPSHLARHFRKLVGLSPKAYRQQVS